MSEFVIKVKDPYEGLEPTETINTSESFCTAGDADIVKNLKDRMLVRFERGQLGLDELKSAMNTLHSLLPHQNERGMTEIGNISISPIMKNTIDSRLNSREIDIVGHEGIWGQLPYEVRMTIVQQSSMTIEMTGTCTVKCHFCALANKGPIENKVSWIAINQLITDFSQRQTPPETQDSLYWGTDPFDAKWRVDGDQVLDYTDLAISYWEKMGRTNAQLSTSTALPIGEELRVIRFMLELNDRTRSGNVTLSNTFRISETAANEHRVKLIRAVIEAIDPSVLSNPQIMIIARKKDDIAQMGKAIIKAKGISMWDIIGPNCIDGVIISPTSIEGVIMEATSNERPNGESRFSVKSEEDGNKVKYTIPIAQKGIHSVANGKSQLETFLPPPTVKELTYDNNALVSESAIQMNENPHRAFLRLIGWLNDLTITGGRDNVEDISIGEKAVFKQQMTREAAILRDYLSIGGRENNAMYAFYIYLARLGFISW